MDSLRLPRPNPYIPEEFDLIHTGETVPPSATPEAPERVLVNAGKELELWYKLDCSFKVRLTDRGGADTSLTA